MLTLTDGPIVYIEDDEDDQFLFERALEDLAFPNETRLFFNGQQAIEYLETTPEKPLLILCDLNMPVMSGLELRGYIDASERLRQKATLFIFYTTAASPEQIKRAYGSTVQGFHAKAPEFPEFKEQIRLIITYWQSCLHPGNF